MCCLVVGAEVLASVAVFVEAVFHPLHHLRDLEAGGLGGQARVGEVVQGGERGAVVKLGRGFHHGRLVVWGGVRDGEHAARGAAELLGNDGELFVCGRSVHAGHCPTRASSVGHHNYPNRTYVPLADEKFHNVDYCSSYPPI